LVSLLLVPSVAFFLLLLSLGAFFVIQPSLFGDTLYASWRNRLLRKKWGDF